MKLLRMSGGILLLALSFSIAGWAQKKQSQLFSENYIKEAMRRVADWQLDNPVSINEKNENDWARAAFYTGLMATYYTTRDERYLNAALEWSQSFDWKLANRWRHADDHAKGQTYLELHQIKKDVKMIEHTRAIFDSLIANPRPGRDDWWWCDALFMAPPVLARLYHATGDKRYLDFLHTMFWDCYDFLYDKEAHLFYRDKGYFEKRTPSGHKTFWARGNGWVMGGIVRVLQYLPKDDPHYSRYTKLLQEMASSVKQIQHKDGLWRPSLLDEQEVPHPETSGSAFFCYAIAWGINEAVLDKKEYLPLVKSAWQGLNSYLTPKGKLQWVQPIGAAPDKVTMDNFQEYGSGAFLLAASEVIKLDLK